MYKSAVILVLLVGTACAFPPNSIWGESVAEDAVDKKDPEVPWQGSEVESQKEDATRESDDELTPTIALSRFEMPSPTSFDRSTEEIEEPRKLCDKTATGCNLLDELAPRQKRNTRTLRLDETLIIPLDKLGLLDISKMRKANLLSHNTEVPYFPGSDMKEPLEGTMIVYDDSDVKRIYISDVSPVDIKSDGSISISLGEVKVPIDISGDNSGSETSANELKKLQEENVVMKKKLEKAEEDLAQQTKKYNDEKNRVEENWKKVLEETKEKKDQERKTLQEKYDKAMKELKQELHDLKEGSQQQPNIVTAVIQKERKECKKALEDYKSTTEKGLKTLQQRNDAEVKALVEELADLEVKFDQQSRNFTRTVQEEKKAWEEALKDNEKGENQEREKLQEKYDKATKELEEVLHDLKKESQKQSNIFTTMIQEGKKECEKSLKDYKATAEKGLKTLQQKNDAEVKALVEELADVEVKYDQQSRNFTTTVQGEKQACEEMLKGNEEEENQERKKLQEKRDDEIKSLKASLTKAEKLSNDLETQMSRLSTNCSTNLEAEKEICNNQLTEQTERAKKELAEREDRIKEQDSRIITLEELLALCRRIKQKSKYVYETFQDVE